MRWLAVPMTVLACLAWIGVPAVADTPVVPADLQPEPHPLSVPWPHVGDAGSYSRSIVRMAEPDGAMLTVTPSAIRESFLVEPTEDRYDEDGVPHRVVSFRTWVVQDGADLRYDLDAEDGSTVSLTLFERSSQGYTNSTFPGGLEHKPPLCGLRNALQGAGDPEEGLVALQGEACRRAYYIGQAWEGYVRVREDPWGDGVAVGFQQAGTEKVAFVWYTSEVPYPVRMLEQTGHDTYAVLDLTHFQRGGEAAARGRSSLPALPPLRMGEHDGVGGDESGVEHPFPWSQAWEAAKGDEVVQQFLADHPEAIVSQSVYNFEERHTRGGMAGERSEDTLADAWYFVLDDGRRAELFGVRHKVGQESIVAPAVGDVATFPVDVIEVEDRERRAADPYSLRAPPVVPTVASSLAWWDAFATKGFREAGANGWMTMLSCGCGKPWGATNVGRLAGTYEAGETTTWSWEASSLVTTWEGKAYVLVENVVESDFGRASLPVRVLGRSIPTSLAAIVEEGLDRLPALQGLPATVPEGGMLDLELASDPGGERPAQTVLSAKMAAAPAMDGRSTGVVVSVAAAGAAGLAGLAWLAKVLLAPLFSRVRRESALDQPVRSTLLDLVEAQPGIHLQELIRRTGKGAGTVRHHLAKLEDVGLVKSRAGGGFLCFFPTDAGAAAMAAAGVTKSDGARRVLEAARSGGTAAELARRTGLAPGTVDHHLARLAAAGVVRRDGGRWLA